MTTAPDQAGPRMNPPPWLNMLMSTMLRTPGLQRLIGRSTALVTVVGRKTGREITTPISYTWLHGSIVLTAHESRQWWRNAQAGPNVRLRLAGKEHTGSVRILRNDEARPYFTTIVEEQPIVAKAHGVTLNNGRADPESVAGALQHTVVVLVDLHK